MNLGRQFLYCRHGCGIDLVIEARGKTHGAEHAQFVFRKTAFGIADGAHDSGFQVVAAADEIQDLVCFWIEHHAVDGEVAALDIFARVFAEAYLVGMTAIGVADVRTEGCHLDGLPQRWRQEQVALFPRSAHRARYEPPLEGVCSRGFVGFVFLRVLCGISVEGH